MPALESKCLFGFALRRTFHNLPALAAQARVDFLALAVGLVVPHAPSRSVLGRRVEEDSRVCGGRQQ
eukprot:2379076-Rhodomonas_salina.1